MMMVVFPQAVYQRIIKLSYVDKLLDQVSLEFRDRYKNEVSSGPFRKVNFDNTFKARLFYSSCWKKKTTHIRFIYIPA